MLLCARNALASDGRAVGFPIVTTYSADQIGRVGKNWGATQDKDGVMYFGRIGLTTFDGERWRTWPMNDAHAVRGLEFGRDGKLWAAGNGDIGWFERNGSEWIFHSLMDRLPEEARALGELWHAFAEGDGAVFVADHTLLHWNGSAFQVWPMPGARRLNAFRSDGRIYVHQPATGIHEVTTTGPRLILPAPAIGDARVWWLQARGEEWMLLTADGFFRFANGNLVPFARDASSVIQRANPSCLLDLRDGRLAIGTVRAGVLLVREDGALEHVVNQPSELTTPMVNGLFLDRDRQLWITSHTSIDRLSLDPASVVFDRRAQLPEKPVINLLAHGGTVVASTDGAIFRLEDDRRTFAVKRADEELIWDVMSAPEGLLSTGYNNVKRMVNGATTVLYAPQADVFLVEPSRFRPGEYLLSERTQILSMNGNGDTRPIARGLPDPATSLAEDAEGRLWLSSSRQGVLFIDPRTSAPADRRPPASVGLPAFRGPAVVGGTKDGTVFVLSTAGGWMLAPHARAFVPIERFPHRAVTALSRAYVSDEIWVGFAATDGRPPSIGRIAVHGSRAVWQPHEVEALHTIATPRSILVQKNSDGTRVLWIGGTKGILRNTLAGGPSAPAPRPPLLREIAYSARDGAQTRINAPLPYSTPRLRFEFAAPEFGRRAALRLESFIEGIDDDWVPAGPDSARELTAVRDGDYRIHVRAVADTGVASPPTSSSFRVLPPWWRTPAAAIGLVLTLLPTGYFSIRLRLRALRRRNAELEEKVRLRTEELEAASAAKTEFVANMSHDIRNPLNGIVGLTLALEDSNLDTRQREIVATLRECTTYLSTLVDDVLDFASIEAGRVELRPGPFVAGELLRSIVTTLKTDTAERGATLTCEADPQLPAHLLGDAGRIQQILVNFVSNALKYAGGHIHLSVACPPDAPGEVEFAVTDHGPGISSEDQATLFTKFTRLERTRRDDIPGSGLGLAACRSLADILGGAVGVESRMGEGARFFLRLPLAVAAEAPEPAAAPASLPNTTVLLVEDTDYNAWAASAVLARLGLTCDRARNGGEAVRMFGEKRYNVVLLDRNLPDMDGTEVAHRIRKMESDGLPAIVLAVTAYCTAEDRALCLAAGMDAFVGKPLTPDKLRRVLLAAGRRLLGGATVDLSRDPAAVELDLTLIKYLSDGTEENFTSQVERYLVTLTDAEAQLAATLRAGDFRELEIQAHRLLGQARMVDGTALAEAALRLDHAARSCDAVACREELQKVVDEMRAITAAMRHRCPVMSRG